MKKVKTIAVKVSAAEYIAIKQNAAKERLSISAYIRFHIEEDISKNWIKKTVVQKILSHIAITLDNYEEKNKHLTDAIRKEFRALWIKL